VLIVDSKNKLGRIATDLIWLRSTLTVPLWVIRFHSVSPRQVALK
jgi:hypothetical protein